MINRLWIGAVGAVLLLSPLTRAQDQKPSPAPREAKSSGMSQDMREAIAWERAKDRAAARQARIEARHPTHFEANRSMDDPDDASKVKDSKAPGAKRDQ
jgi:hypothetical protein